MTCVQRAALVAVELVLLGCDRRGAAQSKPAAGARPAPVPTAVTQASADAPPPAAATAPAGPIAKRPVRTPKMVANAEVGNLVAALRQFADDVGRFPTIEEGLDAISTPPPGVRGWHGPYMRGDARALNDPWGNVYQYRSPGVHNPKAVDVFSTGPDGEESVDDIGNW